METFSKIIGIIITVIFIFVMPIMYFAEKQDTITQSYVQNETVAFVDNVRTQGKITQAMYNDFVSKLDSTGVIYNVTMEHSHVTIDPVYTDDGQFTDEIATNTSVIYENEILYTIYEKKPTEEELESGAVEGEYHFSVGDYFTVSVSNAEKTFATNVKELLFSSEIPTLQILSTYGGEIRDENY